MNSLGQTFKEQEAEELLINIHNIGLQDNPDDLDLAKELRDFDSESLAVIKRNLSFLTRLVNREYTRRNK